MEPFPHQVPFPEPESGEYNGWKDDPFNGKDSPGKIFYRTIDVTYYRDADNDMEPTHDLSFSCCFHKCCFSKFKAMNGEPVLIPKNRMFTEINAVLTVGNSVNSTRF